MLRNHHSRLSVKVRFRIAWNKVGYNPIASPYSKLAGTSIQEVRRIPIDLDTHASSYRTRAHEVLGGKAVLGLCLKSHLPTMRRKVCVEIVNTRPVFSAASSIVHQHRRRTGHYIVRVKLSNFEVIGVRTMLGSSNHPDDCYRSPIRGAQPIAQAKLPSSLELTRSGAPKWMVVGCGDRPRHEPKVYDRILVDEQLSDSLASVTPDTGSVATTLSPTLTLAIGLKEPSAMRTLVLPAKLQARARPLAAPAEPFPFSSHLSALPSPGRMVSSAAIVHPPTDGFSMHPRYSGDGCERQGDRAKVLEEFQWRAGLAFRSD